MADIVVDDALNYLTDESLSRKWTWFLNLDLSLDVTMIFQKKNTKAENYMLYLEEECVIKCLFQEEKK